MRCLDGRTTAYPAHQRLLNLSSADDLAAGVCLRHLRFHVEALAFRHLFAHRGFTTAPYTSPNPLWIACGGQKKHACA